MSCVAYKTKSIYKVVKNRVRVFFLVISLLCGGFVFYEKLEGGFGLLSFYLSILFVISSIITILIPTKSKIRYVHKRVSSFLAWATSIALLFGSILITNSLRNSSPVLFSTTFYWEEGVDVEFRRNRTYKALNHNIFGGTTSYGKYKLEDSLIILEDKLKFGNSNMNDTLIASKNGVSFAMEQPWRIDKGLMSYKYLPNTELIMVNNTNQSIDSVTIKLSYTKENIQPISLKPGQKSSYEFNMKNPYVNGEYELTYKIETHGSTLKKIRNILNGYPLETVEAIHFEEENIVIKLIFGNSITNNYL
jgi:hypothetical protein